MSLLQKYRKDETRKTTPEEEKRINEEPKTEKKKPIPKKETKPKPTVKKSNPPGTRSRPVISATVSLELVDALNRLTEEKYLNRSKFIEDALVRTIRAEFPDFAKRNNL